EGAVNASISGMILKPWNQRKKSQSKLLPALQTKLGKVAGLQAVAFPLPPIPGSSGNLPIQFILKTTEDYGVFYQVIEKLKAAAMNSGLFLYADTDLKFSRPELV